MKSNILDNINQLFGDDLKEELGRGAKLKIAAACFSIYAYEALANELADIQSLQFIFTTPTFVSEDVIEKIAKERREFIIPKAKRENERSLFGTEFEIHLRNKLTQRAVARECAEWMRTKAGFRSNATAQPMQQFAILEKENEKIVYAPLQGFTAVDLGYQPGDFFSNIIHKTAQSSHAKKYLQLFDSLWSNRRKLADITETIREHISTVYQENSAQKVYFFMLYHIFNEFLEDINEDTLPNDLTGYRDSVVWGKLYNFQRDAAVGVINKLEKFNGCILADGVGLGKTFSALAVIKYYELRNRSVLVLCPKKLSGNWLTYNRNLKTNILAEDRFCYDVLCHTDLSRDRGTSLGTPLAQVNWGNYDLVVIDESHNFRNNPFFKDKETRYQKLMRKVIKDGVKTKVLMLSATPVNNRFGDLRNQLALAYEGEAENLERKLRATRPVDEIFRSAQTAFNVWAQLPAEERTGKALLKALDVDFFMLLDSVTIARSRGHVEKYYDTTGIGSFPERLSPAAHRRPLSKKNLDFAYGDIYDRLSNMAMAVYAPMSYILPSRLAKYEEKYDTTFAGNAGRLSQATREKGLQALMTTNLLKRAESSVESFRKTLRGIGAGYQRVLAAIEEYHKSGGDKEVTAAADYSGYEDEDDDFLGAGDAVVGGKVKIDLRDVDLPSWQGALESDAEIINELLAAMKQVTPDDDDKLGHLLENILEKIDRPLNPGNRKVLVFAAFADTVDYLYEHLSPVLLERGIHAAKVTGTKPPKNTLKKGLDFQSVLTLFAPGANHKDKVLPDVQGEIDVLIATDCISEGQNLQDCDYLINYDIHWNPVRIIQRFGRIDRIGSPNRKIQLVNYWPDVELDDYINLKERVENKMVLADISATGDDNPLSQETHEVAYRKEQLERLRNEEMIDFSEIKSGVSISDLGLNDFRMDLYAYMQGAGDLAELPCGLHAVVEAQPEKGLEPGVIFAMRNRNPGLNMQGQNQLHPFYLTYVRDDGTVVKNHNEVKDLLDLARIACKNNETPDMGLCERFNDETDDGRVMGRYSKLLDSVIKSIVDIKENFDIDSFFTDKTSAALAAGISGINDFELIAFVVVLGADDDGTV